MAETFCHFTKNEIKKVKTYKIQLLFFYLFFIKDNSILGYFCKKFLRSKSLVKKILFRSDLCAELNMLFQVCNCQSLRYRLTDILRLVFLIFFCEYIVNYVKINKFYIIKIMCQIFSRLFILYLGKPSIC